MKCPECEATGNRSRVFFDDPPNDEQVGPDLEREVYYDEDGNFHIHDPKEHLYGYKCSAGHRWVRVEKRGCRAGCEDWQESEAVLVGGE